MEALCLDDTVIEVIVDDKLWGASVGKMSEGIPLFIVGAIVPDGAVVVVLDEPAMIGLVVISLFSKNLGRLTRFRRWRRSRLGLLCRRGRRGL